MRSLKKGILVGLLSAAILTGGAASAQAIPNPFTGCKDAPIPAMPAADFAPPEIVKGDPFTDGGPTLLDRYGPKWSFSTYDNGCAPGAGTMPSFGSTLGNWGIRTTAMLTLAIERMQRAILSPSWSKDLNSALQKAAGETFAATWKQWVGVALILVSCLAMVAGRKGEVHKVVTALGRALLVIGIVTMCGLYPAQSVAWVDNTVATATTLITQGTEPAQGVSNDEKLARLHDNIIRATSWNEWLRGTFGDANSKTAKEFGPRLFKATHLSYEEADTWRKDPGGAGKALVEQKQEHYKKVAEEVEKADPVAYLSVTGSDWGKRAEILPVGVVEGLSSGLFEALATIGMALGLVMVRVLVAAGPALGIIWLFEPGMQWAMTQFGRIAKWIVGGPLLMVAALVVLRMNAAIAAAQAGIMQRLGMMIAVSVGAWWLLKPGGSVPGAGLVRRVVGGATGVARYRMMAGAMSGRGHDADAGTRPVGRGPQAPAEDVADRDAPVSSVHLGDLPSTSPRTTSTRGTAWPGERPAPRPELVAAPVPARGAYPAATPADVRGDADAPAAGQDETSWRGESAQTPAAGAPARELAAQIGDEPAAQDLGDERAGRPVPVRQEHGPDTHPQVWRPAAQDSAAGAGPHALRGLARPASEHTGHPVQGIVRTADEHGATHEVSEANVVRDQDGRPVHVIWRPSGSEVRNVQD